MHLLRAGNSGFCYNGARSPCMIGALASPPKPSLPVLREPTTMRTGTTGLRATLLLAGTFLLAGPTLADNWPRFRGPNGTGAAADKDVPLKWSAKENVLWKTPLPGL